MSDDLEKDLRNIVACMRMEGFEVSEETIQKARGILNGELDADAEVAKIVAKYKARSEDVGR